MSSPPDSRDPEWELLERYREELTAQARAILDNLADAEDIVQETFIRALRYRDKLRNTAALGAWLRAINRCTAINRVRGKKSDSRRLLKVQNLEPEQAFTTGGFSIVELRETVEKALEELPEELRQLVRLRYFEHRSYKEIAERMNIPIGNIGGLLLDSSARLYAKLRTQLERGEKQPRSLPPESSSELPRPQPSSDEDNLPTQSAGAIS